MADRNWWTYKPIVTVFDVLEAGACHEGVVKFLRKRPEISRASNSKNEHIFKAGNCDGYGYGDGDGYGDGYGYGYGNGDGDGYWDGYGYGNGDG